MANIAQSRGRRIGIIAGAGALPFAVANTIRARGEVPLLLGLKGYCDAAAMVGWPHHWIALGQFGRVFALLRAEGCRDVMAIGSMVRPAVRELRLDFQTLRMMPSLIGAFRGGDN